MVRTGKTQLTKAATTIQEALPRNRLLLPTTGCPLGFRALRPVLTANPSLGQFEASEKGCQVAESFCHSCDTAPNLWVTPSICDANLPPSGNTEMCFRMCSPLGTHANFYAVCNYHHLCLLAMFLLRCSTRRLLLLYCQS